MRRISKTAIAPLLQNEDSATLEPEDNTAFLNLANFPVPDQPSSGEESGGAEEGEEGSEEGGD